MPSTVQVVSKRGILIQFWTKNPERVTELRPPTLKTPADGEMGAVAKEEVR